MASGYFGVRIFWGQDTLASGYFEDFMVEVEKKLVAKLQWCLLVWFLHIFYEL